MNSPSIIDCKRNIAGYVSVFFDMGVDFYLVSTQWASERVPDPITLHYVSTILTVSGLQPLISTRLEAKPSYVKRGGLFRIANPEPYMVEGKELSTFRSLG